MSARARNGAWAVFRIVGGAAVIAGVAWLLAAVFRPTNAERHERCAVRGGTWVPSEAGCLVPCDGGDSSGHGCEMEA